MLNKDLKDYQQAMEYAVPKVWETLAPGMPLQAYMKANESYGRYLLSFKLNNNLGPKTITPAEAAKIEDNSELFDTMEYKYIGLQLIRELSDKGLPLAFITWHHGARQHCDYAVGRVLPQTAIFTRFTHQYGKVFSYSMEKSQALSLVILQRFLAEKRPILYYLDGAPLGICVPLKILGLTAQVPSTPIKIIRAVKGVKIIPVTNCYQQGNKVLTIFHPPLTDTVLQPSNTEGDVLAELLRLLEDDLRKRAPVQAMWWQIIHRNKWTGAQ